MNSCSRWYNILLVLLFVMSTCFSKKTKNIEQVDVFWGTRVTELNRSAIHSSDEYHFADKWSSLKPRQGNSHPGVVLSFHIVTVSLYGFGMEKFYKTLNLVAKNYVQAES